MKENYESIICEIVEFDTLDVITNSGVVGGHGEEGSRSKTVTSY